MVMKTKIISHEDEDESNGNQTITTPRPILVHKEGAQRRPCAAWLTARALLLHLPAINNHNLEAIHHRRLKLMQDHHRSPAQLGLPNRTQNLGLALCIKDGVPYRMLSAMAASKRLGC
jgi:hypothetical protein